MTPDWGHRQTDKLLEELERRIARVYREAWDDLERTVIDYFDKFVERDEEMKKLVGTVQNGKVWTEKDYEMWRLNQIGRGERFDDLAVKVAERYTHANEVAISYVNDATPGVYSLNRNYTNYSIEHHIGDCGFTLYDESTVRRLIVDEPDSMPYYPPKRAVQRGIDLAYGKRQITASVTSSIIRGRSIKGMADDLQQRINTMSRTSAIRAARTASTCAQNAGRQDSYEAAYKMGIKVRKRWVATKDNRTRHEHGRADGQAVPHDCPFEVGGYKLMFPGDATGPAHLIYNCRCTMRTVEKDGIEAEPRQMRVRNPATGRNELVSEMSYSEWTEWKKSSGKSAGGSSSKPGEPIQVGTVDFADKKAVISKLEAVEKQLERLDYEVNCTVTSDGKVWFVSGEAGSVNPSAIPSSLKGSYSYHNHPAKQTNYSFSAEDAAFFIESGEAFSKASDDLFEYVMQRTAETVEKPRDEVYHRFKEIESTEVFRLKFKELIDPDQDGFHAIMKILSQELKFSYGRKKKLNENHPDCEEYAAKFHAIHDAYIRERDAIDAAGWKDHPDWRGRDVPWNEELVKNSRKHNAELKKLQEEYSYLFTEVTEDES